MIFLIVIAPFIRPGVLILQNRLDQAYKISGTNIEGWEKNTDSWWWWRFIYYLRPHINPFPVAIRLIINAPAIYIAVVASPASSVIVMASVMVSLAFLITLVFLVVFTEGRRYVHTANRYG